MSSSQSATTSKLRLAYKEVFGESTMDHGSTRFPNEYFMLDLITDVTPRQKSVLLALMATNSFTREKNHLPTYISQEKLGFRVGVTQQMISATYKQLKNKKFECPFCKYTKEGYIIVEKVKKRTRQNPWGADNVWTCPYKEIINHLCQHFQEYQDKYGTEDAPDRFIEDALAKCKNMGVNKEPEDLSFMKFGPLTEGDF